MTNTTEVQETKVLWDVSADQLYVWDSTSKAWELFYSAANLVTEDALTEALETKLDITGGTISGALNITKALSVTGDITGAGALSLTGSATIGNALTASGNITAGGTVTGAVVKATGNATIGGTLTVTGAATLTGGISGALSVTGAITGSGNLTAGGDLTAGGSLAIGGASVDDTNVLIAEGSNALFSNPDGSFGFVFSKSTTAKDASITYQVNYATRAMAGLLGDDNYTIKVTPDASNWMTAMVVDNATGAIEHTQGAKFEAVTNYNNYIAAGTWTKIAFNSAEHNDYSAFDASNNRFTAPVDGYYLIGTSWMFYVNGTVPDHILTRLYLNGSALDRTLAASSGTVTSERTTVQTQTILSLSKDDYVEVYAYMETNDGYVYATGSLFYGARIA